jgi:hypothetical protein
MRFHPRGHSDVGSTAAKKLQVITFDLSALPPADSTAAPFFLIGRFTVTTILTNRTNNIHTQLLKRML